MNLIHKIIFSKRAMRDLLDWKTSNKKIYDRINFLLQDICENHPFGIGKPEKLKNNLSGCWSRRIDGKTRLVYEITDYVLYIYSCKGHYENK